jgi:hypothetical protein
MEHMPCGAFEANAAFFVIGVTTYMEFRRVAPGTEWERAQTLRRCLFQVAAAMAAQKIQRTCHCGQIAGLRITSNPNTVSSSSSRDL